MKNKLKYTLCEISFIMGILFGIAGIAIPPYGIIDNSVLILIGQLLVFTSSILGININLKK